LFFYKKIKQLNLNFNYNISVKCTQTVFFIMQCVQSFPSQNEETSIKIEYMNFINSGVKILMKNIKLVPILLASILIFSCSSKNSLNLAQSKLTTGVSASSVVVGSTISAKDSERLSEINTAIDFATGTQNTLNNYNVKYYIDGPKAFPELQKMIIDAKECIYIEVFQFENDYVGRIISDALIEKVKQGVKVFFMYEYIANNNVTLINKMAKNGVIVETYNKQAINSNLTNATHRKLYIFDGKSAMTGGMNIGNEYLLGEWHDVLMSFEGDAVKEMMKEYYHDWKKAGGTVISYMENLYNRRLETKPAGEKTYPLRIAVTSPSEEDKKEDIKRMMLAAMGSAKINIKIAMPYFSEDEFVNLMKIAAKRGIRVTALIPYKSDKGSYDKLNTMTSNDLLTAGVDVYRGDFETKTFNHSKVMTVDNVWTAIGSCNADSLSLTKNQELDVAVSDPEFTKDFNEDFFAHHLKNAQKAEHVDIAWYQKPIFSFLESIDDLL